jgi:C-terminal processing protease CtpA/Prc
MGIEILLTAMLSGHISNEHGRIGVRVSKYGRVWHVYDHSPAKLYGIEEGDVVISADRVKGIKHIDGPLSQVLLEIRRGNNVMYFKVPRVNPKEVYDYTN